MQLLTTSESKIGSSNPNPDDQFARSADFNKRSNGQRVVGVLAQLAFALSVVAFAELCSSVVSTAATQMTIFAVILCAAYSVVRDGFCPGRLRRVSVFARQHPIWKGVVTIAILTLAFANIADIFQLVQMECDIKEFIKGRGNARIAKITVSPWFWTGQDDSHNEQRSRLIIMEDGAVLTKPHKSRSKVSKSGKGRYSHWGDYGDPASLIYFSSSDNSDPLTNGRKYTIKCPVTLNPLIFNTWVMCLMGLLGSWLLLPVNAARRTLDLPCALSPKLDLRARFKSVGKDLADALIYATPLPFLMEHGLVALPVFASAVLGMAFIIYSINAIFALGVTESTCCSLAACALLTLAVVSLAIRFDKTRPEQVDSLRRFLIKHRTIQAAVSLSIVCGASIAIAVLLQQSIHASIDRVFVGGAQSPGMVPTLSLLDPYLAYFFGFGFLFVGWRFYSYLNASSLNASSDCGNATSDCGITRSSEPTNPLVRSEGESAAKNRTVQTGWLAGFIVLIACLAVGVGACYRTTNISSRPFWQDEAFTTTIISSRNYDLLRKAPMTGKPYPASVWKEVDRVHETTITASVAEVLRNLAVKLPPDQAPLYYIVCRLIGKWFDYSDFSMRLVSVVASLISMPLVFLLTRRMFANPLCAWMALAVVASSPFQLVYSHEARPYTLWLCFVLLSFIALDQAIKSGKLRDWVLFGCASATTCLTHLSSVLLTAVTFLPWLRKKYKPISAGLLLGLLIFAIVFMQWFALTGLAITKSGQDGWLGTVIAGQLYFDLIYRNLQAMFFDVPGLDIGVPVILLEVACVIFAFRRATPLGRNVIISAGLFVLLFCALDFTLGGLRMTVARYLMPSVAILQICAAASVVEVFRKRRFVLASVAVIFLGAQFYSCFLINSSVSWLPKSPYDVYVTALLNQTKHGLLIEGNHQQLQALRRSVNPSVLLELAGSEGSFLIPAETTRIVLEDPSGKKSRVVSQIAASGNWKVQTWPLCPIIMLERPDPPGDSLHRPQYRDVVVHVERAKR